MDLHRKLTLVLELAERLGISVRHAPLGGEGGGLCTVKGNRVLFVDSNADTATQFQRCIADLAPLAEIDSLFISPEIRDDLHRARLEAD